MWNTTSYNITMCEGDYGISLPITISGIEFGTGDNLRFTFKTEANGNTILEKIFTPTENTIELLFSEAESALFPIGAYVYNLDWYNGDTFMCNIIQVATFRVVDKA